MLINDREPIEHRCPMILEPRRRRRDGPGDPRRLGPPRRRHRRPKTRSPGPEGRAAAGQGEPKGETLHYSGKVKDKDTGKPIAGAIVTVRRQDRQPGRRTASSRRRRHTTNAEGVYSFTIPPEQVAVKRLYIELDVEHPDYATRPASATPCR